MSNFLSHRLSLREKIFILILVVVLLVGLYFLLVHYPIVDRQEQIAKELEAVRQEQLDANLDKNEYDMMKEEQDHIKYLESHGQQPTVMPEYNVENSGKLYTMINRIFDDAKLKYGNDAYSDRTFDQQAPKMLNNDSNIVMRVVTFTSFTCKNYDVAKFIIDNLVRNPENWRNLMTNVVLTSKDGENIKSNTPITVSNLTITFYERGTITEG